MSFWEGYLSDLLGADEHGRSNTDATLSLIGSLASPRLTAQNLIDLIEWLTKFDTLRQTFVLPHIFELLGERSRSLKIRILDFADTLVGESVRPILEDIAELVQSPTPKERHLRVVLEGLASFVMETEGEESEGRGDLSTLLEDRELIFAFSALKGLHAWCERHPTGERLAPMLSDFFSQDDQEELGKTLLDLLEHGSLYVRYLIVDWIGTSGIALGEQNQRSLLFERYRWDPSPVVAGRAIEVYAWLAEPSEVEATVERLELELFYLEQRESSLQKAKTIGAEEGVRCLLGSILQAVGGLASRNPQHAKPRELLCRVVTAHDQNRVDLFKIRPRNLRAKVFGAALALYGEQVWFKVGDIWRDGRKRLRGKVGLGEPIWLDEPKKSLPNDAPAYWCALSTDGDRRRFRLVETASRKDWGARSLLGLISPRIRTLAMAKTPRRLDGKLRLRCERELRRRAFWSRLVLQAVSSLLKPYFNGFADREAIDSVADLQTLWAFLVDTSEAAEVAAHREEAIGVDGYRLRQRSRHLLLNDLATPACFDRLFDGEVDPVRGHLLAGLAFAAMRSSDTDPAYRWINGNLARLRRIAESSDYRPFDRGTAAAVVDLRLLRRGEAPTRETTTIDLPIDPDALTGEVRRVLPFVPDATLAAVYARLEESADREQLLAAPEQVPEALNQMIVRAEASARFLAGVDLAGADSDFDLDVCLAAASGSQRGILPETLRRRLMTAFVGADPARRARGRRLFEQLLRSATGVQLLAVLRLALQQEDPELEIALGLVMERRLDSRRWIPRGMHHRFDSQTVVDLATLRSVPLSFLYRLAQRDPDFIRQLLVRRREGRRRAETNGVVAAHGEVRRIEGVSEWIAPAELRPMRRVSSAPPVVDSAIGVTPSFAYFDDEQTEVRCLAGLRRAPQGTVDFHDLDRSPSSAKALLGQLLVSRKEVLVAARVVEGCAEAPGGSQATLDLGVPIPGHGARVTTSLDHCAASGDVVIVRVRREAATKTVLDGARFDLWKGGDAAEPVDLRLQENPISWLQKRRDEDPLLVKAKVTGELAYDDGRVRSFLEAGFRIFHEGAEKRQPSLLGPAEAAPPIGEEVVLAASRLNFRQIKTGGALSHSIDLLAGGDGLQEDQRVFGRLRSEKSDGRRSWWAEVGGETLEVPRSELTGDLRRLFELDALDEDSPLLGHLRRENVELRVLSGGRGSVVRAEPSLSLADLIVGVGGRFGNEATMVSRLPSGGAVLEFAPEVALEQAPGEEPLLGLGVLAKIEQGELFDRSGEPVALGDLRRGTRLSFAVHEEEGPADDHSGRRQPPIHLRLAEELDGENCRIEELFCEQEVVSLHLDDGGRLAAVDLLLDVPMPSFQLANDGRSRVLLEKGETLDLEVARDWDPWSENYAVQVRPLRSHRLTIDGTHPKEDVRHYLELQPGSRLRKNSRFARDRKSQRLVAYAGGLRVVVDSLTSYLLPAPADLEPAHIQSRTVLLTSVTTPSLQRSHDELPIDSVPLASGPGSLVGLVESTPAQSSSRQIGVRWVIGDLEETGRQDVVASTLQTDKFFFTGDIVYARRQGRRVRLDRQRRYFEGTFLYEAAPLSKWLRRRKRRKDVVRAKLLCRPAGGSGWLFCLEPAELVEVAADRLLEAERLDDAVALDDVKLQVLQRPGAGEMLAVVQVRDGLCSRAQQGRSLLALDWYDDASQLFRARLKPSGGQLPPLELELRGSELPPGSDVSALRRQARHKDRQSRPELACLIEDFELVCSRQGAGWRFELDVSLGRFQVTRRPKVTGRRQPDLEEALSQRSVVEGAKGRTEATADGLGARLTRYAHARSLPLPLSEQTWLYYMGHLPKAGEHRTFTVFRDESGQATASLRRQRPRDLTTWLKTNGIRTPSRRLSISIRFVGAMDEEMLEQCGLTAQRDEPHDVPAEPLLLFEVGPGETFTARSGQLRFLGEPFTSKTLHRGDEVTEIQVVDRVAEGELEGQPILDILTFTLDIVEGLEQLKRGSLFARVSVAGDYVEIEQLFGLGYNRGRVNERRFGRWRRVLQKVSAEELERLSRLRKDEYVYLQFVRADRKHGLLIFRLATTEEIFKRNRFVFVVAEGVSKYGPSWKLDVRPLDASFRGDYFIPDTLFSERRGRLAALGPSLEKQILLAQVQALPEKGAKRGKRGSSYKLSLLQNPPRRFRYLMGRPSWHVIVKDRSKDKKSLYVEAGIGVQVDIPLFRLARAPRSAGRGPRALTQTPSSGQILILDLLEEERRLVIRDRIRGHLGYLPFAKRPIVQATLWGEEKYRRGQFGRGKPLDCSLIGLPQIHGQLQVSKQNLETFARVEGAVALKVEDVEHGGQRVLLSDRLDGAKQHAVGRLAISAQGETAFECRDGERFELSPARLTWRRGTDAETVEYLRRLRWRDVAGGAQQSIEEAEIVAVCDEQGRLSLTAAARSPHPVDHLVEQFSLRRRRARSERATFIVAKSDLKHRRLVLEIAPGRYAELPTSLIVPLHPKARLAAGRELSWHRLAAGDEVTIELVPSRDVDAFLPSFRVVKQKIRRTLPGGRDLCLPLSDSPEGPMLGLGDCRLPAPWLRHLLRRREFQAEDRVLVRGGPRRFEIVNQPSKGDQVLVYRADGGGECRVAGFESHEINWLETRGDAFRLERDRDREWILDHLLAGGGTFWATCEGVGRSGLALSRRRQIEGALPAADEVVRARILRPLDSSNWLVDVYGVPMLLASRFFFYGSGEDVEALGEQLATRFEGGLDVELVYLEQGLSALHVYRSPKGEPSGQVELGTDTGVLVAAEGSRFYLPAEELTWCGAVPGLLLRRLFPPGRQLRLAPLGQSKNRWSHVATYAIQSEVEEMARQRGAVAVVAKGKEGKRTVVEAPSGTLIELRGSAEIGSRLIAFVQKVDPVHRRILVSLEEVPRRRWNFPQSKISKLHRFGRWSEPAFSQWLQELEKAVQEAGAPAGYVWAGLFPAVRDDAENIRFVLDRLGADGPLIDRGWGLRSPEEDTRLQKVLRRLALVIDGSLEIAALKAVERFALGYRMLQQGRPELALELLEKLPGPGRELDADAGIAPNREIETSFAAQLSYVVAASRCGEPHKAAAALRALLECLWANAARTLPLPLVEPFSPDFQDPLAEPWRQALSAGDIDAMASIRRRQPPSVLRSARELTFRVWRRLVEGRLDDFDAMAEQFFDAVSLDIEELGELDWQVYALAALLEFSRGQVVEGWRWLDHLAASSSARSGGAKQVAVPLFWQRYLAAKLDESEGLDPLLVEAHRLHQDLQWRRALPPSAIEELWRLYCRSPHRLTLDLPSVRAVAPIPEDAEALTRWCHLHRLPEGLSGLRAAANRR